MSKGIEPISPKNPHAISGPGKRKDEREIVEEQEETAVSQSCKRKRLTEVLKAPKLSPAKTDSCNPFHNRTQDRTKECEDDCFAITGNCRKRIRLSQEYLEALQEKKNRIY